METEGLFATMGELRDAREHGSPGEGALLNSHGEHRPKPDRRWVIDRIDHDGPCEPGNCRWLHVLNELNHGKN
jgi:hypothetical protein